MKQKSKEHPLYYAIIPATVRYNQDLSEFQKLLYGEITALADKQGYCRAGNSYFARLYNKDKNRVSKCLTDMEKKWFIRCSVEKSAGNIRKIFITDPASKLLPIEQKQKSYETKTQEGRIENDNTPIEQKHNHNTTSTNTLNSSSTHYPALWWNETDYLKVWNSATNRNELMNSEIKKELHTLCINGIDQFSNKVAVFQNVVAIIIEKKLHKYLYYPVRNYDFMQFAKRINRFDEGYPANVIISKLGKKEEGRTIERLLAKEISHIPSHWVNTNIVDKTRAMAALQKAAVALKTK